MIDIGVASPSAQGQAMISTATALTSAWLIAGSGPHIDQTAKVTIAVSTTAGTNHAETLSARAWIGARERCASATMRTICESIVSWPTRSAFMSKLPVPFTVAPVTFSPWTFSTGTGSPLIIDSSTEDRPSVTTPSTGTFSPGRTRKRSPGWTSSRATSSSEPSSRTIRAVFGASPRSARIARPVAERARNSSTCPSSTSVVMIAAASK